MRLFTYLDEIGMAGLEFNCHNASLAVLIENASLKSGQGRTFTNVLAQYNGSELAAD